MAIAPDRYGRLLNTLLNCAPIASNETLADVFADERLSPWWFEVPEANSRAARVRTLIPFLARQTHHTYQKNGLALFLEVLCDRTDPQDSCQAEVAALAQEFASFRGLPAQPTTKEGRVRQALMDKVRTFWVEGVLEKSLYGVARLELGLEYDPEAVERPWMMTLERPHTLEEAIPPGTPMIALFEKLNRSLLILGEPGSGKTTMLLELARDLLESAAFDATQPIPLVFNLSSWAQKREPLFQWLAKELNRTYQVNKKFGREWLQSEPVRLLLDGLDEVAMEHRDACVEAINEFRQEYGLTDMAICSRTADYAQLTPRLQLPGAVKIQPMTEERLDRYLVAAGKSFAAIRNDIQTDTILKELIQSPLTLSILTLAYRDYPPDQLSRGDLEQRRQHLFATYVERMFQRRSTAIVNSPTQAVRWLSWLASQMAINSQTVFLLEWLQPDSLPKEKHQLMFKFINGLLWGLFISLNGGIIASFISKNILSLLYLMAYGLILGVIMGLIYALVYGKATITPVETLVLTGVSVLVRNSLIMGLSLGLILSLIFGRWEPGLLIGLVIGSIGGLINGLILGIRGEEIEAKTIPNQGIRRSITNGLQIWLFGGLLLGLLISISVWVLEAQQSGLRIDLLIRELGDGLPIGLSLGIIFGLRLGGEAVIKHWVLRFFLYILNYLPWRLIPFLDEMSDLLILRKVGGGYIFVHRMLMEYFASLYQEGKGATEQGS